MSEVPPPNTGASPLYTREILAAAMQLADCQLKTQLPLQHEMRSQTCGSAVKVTMAVNGAKVSDFGISAQACALGQASSALLAQHVKGRSLAEIKSAQAQLSEYLYGQSDSAGNWPGIDMLMPAKDYPARRDSVLLPWRTTIAAFEKNGNT